MINKKATIGEIVQDNLIYLILLVIFFAGMMMFVYSKTNGASVWEDYYAKDIVKIIDLSNPGDMVMLDVQKATGIAQKNKVDSFEEIFQFDNIKGELCVKLSRGRASCYSYMNDVNVIFADDTNKWIYYSETTNDVNRLHFKIASREASK
jgi:hypothetical protein